MRTLLLLVNLIAFYTLSAQVITTDFQYQVGEQRQVVTNPPQANNFFFTTEAGSDLVWNFKSLPVPESSTFTTVVSPVSLSLADTFSRANFGLKVDGSQREDYLIQTDSTVELAGFLTDNGMQILFPNSSKIMQFPFALGESFTDDFTNVVINATGDTVQQNQFTITYDFMATGTLQLPNADYENCYLIRNEASTNGNPPTTIVYRWYAGSLANQMMEIVVNKSDDLAAFATWQKGLVEVVNIKDEFDNQLTVRWLAQNSFVVDNDEQREVQITVTDASGRLIWQRKQDIIEGKQQIEIPNLSAAGAYFFTIQDVKTKALKTVQFSTYF
ncbi:MAG: T9SS type A sorting domain-containing protein [Saprospiraceae bacterium]